MFGVVDNKIENNYEAGQRQNCEDPGKLSEKCLDMVICGFTANHIRVEGETSMKVVNSSTDRAVLMRSRFRFT